MRTTVAAAVGALVAASSTLAAPSPKFAYMKDRFKSQRIPVNFNLDVSKNQYNSSAYNLTDVPAAPTAKAPHKNVWAGLSNDEAAGVIGFLHNQTDLNLTAAADAGPWDNLITTLDILTPNKTVRFFLPQASHTVC